MKPIYDKHGRTVGWLKEDTIYDLNGTPRAYIREGAIFTHL